MDDIIQRIDALYREVGSIKQVVKIMGISNTTVRKALITTGARPTEISEGIARMEGKGYKKEIILRAMNISEGQYASHTPYIRGSYLNEDKTENARRVAACRARKKQKEVTKMKTALNEFSVSVISETTPSLGDWYCQELHELIKTRFGDYDSRGILLRETAVAEVVAASDNAIIQNTDSYRYAVEAIKEDKA